MSISVADLRPHNGPSHLPRLSSYSHHLLYSQSTHAHAANVRNDFLLISGPAPQTSLSLGLSLSSRPFPTCFQEQGYSSSLRFLCTSHSSGCGSSSSFLPVYCNLLDMRNAPGSSPGGDIINTSDSIYVLSTMSLMRMDSANVWVFGMSCHSLPLPSFDSSILVSWSLGVEQPILASPHSRYISESFSALE